MERQEGCLGLCTGGIHGAFELVHHDVHTSFDRPTLCTHPLSLPTSKTEKPKQPTCHINHIPPYIKLFDQFKGKGVDVIAVLAANDPFVMSGWSRVEGFKDKVGGICVC
jgi:hypothetical protein